MKNIEIFGFLLLFTLMTISCFTTATGLAKFDMVYFVTFSIVYSLILFKQFRKAYYKYTKQNKIPEIVLLIVCISAIPLLFSFHTNVVNQSDPPEDKSDPLKWIKPSQIVNHPLKQLRRINGIDRQEIMFNTDSIKNIINILVLDATRYKNDNDTNLVFFKELRNFLLTEITKDSKRTNIDSSLNISQLIAKYQLCKSIELKQLKGLTDNQKNVYSCFAIYSGNSTIKTDSNDFLFDNIALDTLLKNNKVNLGLNSVPETGVTTQFELLFQSLKNEILNKNELTNTPNKKINITIISDFIEEFGKGKNRLESEKNICTAITELLHDFPSISRINLIKCSTKGPNVEINPKTQYPAEEIIRKEIENNNIFSEYTEINTPETNGIKCKLKTTWFDIACDSDKTLLATQPYNFGNNNKAVVTKMKIEKVKNNGFLIFEILNNTRERDNRLEIYCEGKLQNNLWSNDASDFKSLDSDELDLVYKLKDFKDNYCAVKLISSEKTMIKKYDVIFFENNSISNSTILLLLYSAGNTSIFLILLSPLACFFLAKNRQIEKEIPYKWYKRFAILISTLMLILPAYFFYHTSSMLGSIKKFSNFTLPILVSLAIYFITLWKIWHDTLGYDVKDEDKDNSK